MSSVEVIEIEAGEAGQPLPTPRNQTANAKVNQLVLSQACRVYGFTCFSTNAAAQFVLMFEQMTLPADGTVPLMPFSIAAATNLGVLFGKTGRVFRSGFVLCTSSTSATKTLNATVDTFMDVQYDRLD